MKQHLYSTKITFHPFFENVFQAMQEVKSIKHLFV